MLLVEHGVVAHPPGLVRTYFHGFASFLSVLTLSLCSCAAASALSSSPPTFSVSQRVSVHAGKRSGTTKSHRQTNACPTSFFPSTEKGKRKKKNPPALRLNPQVPRWRPITWRQESTLLGAPLKSHTPKVSRCSRGDVFTHETYPTLQSATKLLTYKYSPQKIKTESAPSVTSLLNFLLFFFYC